MIVAAPAVAIPMVVPSTGIVLMEILVRAPVCLMPVAMFAPVLEAFGVGSLMCFPELLMKPLMLEVIHLMLEVRHIITVIMSQGGFERSHE